MAPRFAYRLLLGRRLDGLRALAAALDLDLPRRHDRLGHVLHAEPQQALVRLGLDLVGRHALGQLEGTAEGAVPYLAHEDLALGVLPLVAALTTDREPALG